MPKRIARPAVPQAMYTWTTLLLLLLLGGVHLFLLLGPTPVWLQGIPRIGPFIFNVGIWLLLILLGLRMIATGSSFLPKESASYISWGIIVPSWILGVFGYVGSELANADLGLIGLLILGAVFGAIRVLPTIVCLTAVVLHLWLWIHSSPSARVYIVKLHSGQSNGHHVRDITGKLWVNPDRVEAPRFTEDIDVAHEFPTKGEAVRAVQSHGLTQMLWFWEKPA